MLVVKSIQENVSCVCMHNIYMADNHKNCSLAMNNFKNVSIMLTHACKDTYTSEELLIPSVSIVSILNIYYFSYVLFIQYKAFNLKFNQVMLSAKYTNSLET